MNSFMIQYFYTECNNVKYLFIPLAIEVLKIAIAWYKL